MSSKPAQPLLRPWPPLITGARLPRWIVCRDLLFTLLAWGVLGWMLRDPIHLKYDYLSYPFFQLTSAKPPDWFVLWSGLGPFVLISIGLIASIFVRALTVRRRLSGEMRYPQPSALSIAAESARARLDEKSIIDARKLKIVNVRFHDDGTIARFEGEIREPVTGAIEPPSPQP